jgi:2-keto-3-deoxy-L-arabinonate dehydratase
VGRIDWAGGICLPAYGGEFYKLAESVRDLVIRVAIEQSRRRTPVIAQANHASARIAAGLARRYEEMGADVISVAIPRQFSSSPSDILEYCVNVASATTLPLMIQDFNPGGTTIGFDFVVALSVRCENFQFVKLEDPMMIDKLITIREHVGPRIGIFEGWGGLYMLEGIWSGIDGVMPGAAIADLLSAVYAAAASGDQAEVHDHFGSLLPYITFALQDFELFLQIEKRTLVRRGTVQQLTVRSLSNSPSPSVLPHIDFWIDQVERKIVFR